MGDINNRINRHAHENCIRKLNRANDRIVEFEDIKKDHMVYVEKLRAENQRLKDALQRIANKYPGDLLSPVDQQDIAKDVLRETGSCK